MPYLKFGGFEEISFVPVQLVFFGAENVENESGKQETDERQNDAGGGQWRRRPPRHPHGAVLGIRRH